MPAPAASIHFYQNRHRFNFPPTLLRISHWNRLGFLAPSSFRVPCSRLNLCMLCSKLLRIFNPPRITAMPITQETTASCSRSDHCFHDLAWSLLGRRSFNRLRTAIINTHFQLNAAATGNILQVSSCSACAIIASDSPCQRCKSNRPYSSQNTICILHNTHSTGDHLGQDNFASKLPKLDSSY
eukprot:Gb_00153 [translate_table: standard]